MQHDVPCALLDQDALNAKFPFFRFPQGHTGAFEPDRAGHVSPRRLVAAQTKAAKSLGATLLPETVQGIDEQKAGVTLTTDQGTHRFDYVLVAAGYNSDTVLGRAPQMDVYARTIALFELSDAQAARLSAMPTLVYDTPEDPYLLPPIRYPDGKLYLKLGGDPEDVPLVGSDAIRDWFHLGGNIQVRDHLHAMVMDLMPDLQVERVTMDACVTTWTKDRRPEIQWLSDRVAICAGGNGAGAKCSDEMGRLGAAMVQQRTGENA